MDITTEYERLKALAASTEGWTQIDRAWHEAMGDDRPREGRQLNGFAIDTVTKHCILDTNSLDHERAQREMIQLLQQKFGATLENAQFRSIRGWTGHLLDFAFPWIFMASARFLLSDRTLNFDLVDELDASILEQGVGMSITGMYIRHHAHSMFLKAPPT